MGLVGIGVGASEGLLVDMAIVKDVESTLMLTPRIALTEEEKDGFVSVSFISDDKSETETEVK